MESSEVLDFARAYIAAHWDQIVADIDTLCQVNSVEDKEHETPGAPFGPAPREALDRALGIARRLGLPTFDNCDGYMGYAELAGTSGKQVATIAHSDIVPTGEGWHFEPLAATRKDGYLIGRGTMDDKGALVLSLHAAAALKAYYEKTGTTLTHSIRTLIGTNEETGMADVPYYLERHAAPDFLFTPDADFPLIYGEKGHYMGTFTSADLGSDPQLVELSCGTVPNAVPGRAYAVVSGQVEDFPAAEYVTLTQEDPEHVRIFAEGIGGHASLPEGTRNAIQILVNYLLANVKLNPQEAEFLQLSQVATASFDGSSLGVAAQDEAFGPLTCVGGVLKRMGDHLVQTVDSRYPTTITGDVLTQAMSELAVKYHASFEVGADDVPYIGDPKSAPVVALWNAFHEVTGSEEPGYTIGGGTYARHFPRACAFGPNLSREDYPDWVGFEHGPDEGISEANLQQALEIYILALHNLQNSEL